MRVRPRDAAGLVVLQENPKSSDDPLVLLGQRHAQSRFMPNVFVFPGGCREPEDALPSGFPEALPRAAQGRVDGETRRRLAVYARTALRETLEETGFLLAAPPSANTARQQQAGSAGIWGSYAERGLVPHFSAMTLLARAITPAGSPLRFHSRFFLALGSHLEKVSESDGELQGIGWYPASRALKDMPLAGISRLILAEALLARENGAGHAAVLFRSVSEKRMIRCGGNCVGGA